MIRGLQPGLDRLQLLHFSRRALLCPLGCGVVSQPLQAGHRIYSGAIEPDQCFDLVFDALCRIDNGAAFVHFRVYNVLRGGGSIVVGKLIFGPLGCNIVL